MAWFRKDKSGVEAQQKRNIPEGLWTKCQSCGEIAYSKKLEELLWICPNCDFHFRISSPIINRILQIVKYNYSS